jgi:hypothetical protein
MSRKKTKEPMIACPSCGLQNRIASPFCKECGGRIYQGGAAPSPETTTSKKKNSVGGAFKSGINALLFLAVVSVFGLALWPYASLSVPVSEDSSKSFERYLGLVEDAIENEQSLAVARIPQRNLNAYLGMNNQQDENKILGVVYGSTDLELIANEPLGPFNLSTRMVLKPSDDASFLRVSDFWVGHLPLPAFWVKPWSQSLADRFDLELRKTLWDHLTLLKLERSQLFIEFQP